MLGSFSTEGWKGWEKPVIEVLLNQKNVGKCGRRWSARQDRLMHLVHLITGVLAFIATRQNFRLSVIALSSAFYRPLNDMGCTFRIQQALTDSS